MFPKNFKIMGQFFDLKYYSKQVCRRLNSKEGLLIRQHYHYLINFS